jgi:hypothetical protein
MIFIFGYRTIKLYVKNNFEEDIRYFENRKNVTQNEDLLFPILNKNKEKNPPFVYKPNNLPYNQTQQKQINKKLNLSANSKPMSND